MTSSRFFISNLPANAKQKHLTKLFENFGEVQNVELKSKENLVDPNDLKIIAFVTLGIDTGAVQQCLREVNGQMIKGQKITVALAKESFLERLKRERAEASNEKAIPASINHSESSILLKPNSRNKRLVFDINEEHNAADDTDTDQLLIKKQARTSLCNGKIVIESYGSAVQPLHVIEKRTNRKRKISETEISKTVAEEKRKASLYKMKNQYQQQKSIIQQSLQDNLKANKTKNTKLRFDDDADDNGNNLKADPHDTTLSKSNKKVNIFGTDNEDDDDDDHASNKELKPFFLGKKGSKLAELKAAKQSMDPRFRIDEKFVDDDEDDGVDDSQNCKTHSGEVKDNERDWQMNILEQVVGKQLTTIAPSKSRNINMLRYDPTKTEHQKFDLKVEKTIKEPANKTKSAVDASSASNEVSKEVFYVVSDTLKQSLKTHDGSFSLLKMFGKSEDQLEKRGDQLKELNNEKILVRKNNKLGRAMISNPFTYDSSSESEFESNFECKPTETMDNKHSSEPSKKQKHQLKGESFFLSKTDERFKEGSNFFKLNNSQTRTEESENYDEVRSRLKLLIKKKIMKTKKNLQNAGYKSKHRSKH